MPSSPRRAAVSSALFVLAAFLGAAALAGCDAPLTGVPPHAPDACAELAPCITDPLSMPAEPTLDVHEAATAASCGTCHADHAEEWGGSMHAYAMTDPVFRALVGVRQPTRAPARPATCAPRDARSSRAASLASRTRIASRASTSRSSTACSTTTPSPRPAPTSMRSSRPSRPSRSRSHRASRPAMRSRSPSTSRACSTVTISRRARRFSARCGSSSSSPTRRARASTRPARSTTPATSAITGAASRPRANLTSSPSRPRSPTPTASPSSSRGAPCVTTSARSRPLERRQSSFTFRVPASTAGALTIAARLRFRTHAPFVLRALGLGELVPRVAIRDLAKADVTVDVVR